MAPSRARTVSRPRQPDREVGTLMRISTRENFDGPTVAVGTPVREGHANYLLMYDMLTGIRVSVLRCGARPDRELEEGDFVAAHKLAFDVSGNELAPKSGYDFKFKDYSPWVFRHIRSLFNIEEDDYLVSLTGKYVLSELGSPGKSGSFFYYSQDYRFIIKTVHKSEHKFLRAILKNYYAHLQANPNTLLSRIFGLHRVKMPRKRKIHFVVMGNVFPADRDVHETYDLKGSTAGREVSEAEAADSPIKVLKDNNWVTKGRRLQLGPLKRKQLVEQIRKDAEFLERNHIMDYSLLVGFHDLATGNESNIRDKTLAVFEPNIASIHRNHSLHHRRSFSSPVSPTFPSIENLTHGRSGSARSPTTATLHRAATLRNPDPFRLGASAALLPDAMLPERAPFTFYREMGGFRATDARDVGVGEVYYVGIIDIFTKYDAIKRVEHFFKSLVTDGRKISAVNPHLYKARFLDFIERTAVPSAESSSATTSP
ncbi:hypothetical protein DFJ73DRAFT_789362 [Zopfochytrium polystomum]|nr:hypothetical protein DFJ73DRAFT_789362 [Zopfochytrium polystomum]